MRTMAVWIGAVLLVGGLWSASAVSQGVADEPAVPSSASEGTGGAAGNETGGADTVPPVIEGEPALPAESGEVQSRAVPQLVRLQNYWKPYEYVHIENGPVAAGPISVGWTSARWYLELIPGSTVYRIQNVWQGDRYLNIESGALQASTIAPGWISARWTLELIPGSTVYRIRNVWQGDQYLNIESGSLQASAIQPGWLSAMWTLSFDATVVAAPAPPPVVQPAPIVPKVPGITGPTTGTFTLETRPSDFDLAYAYAPIHYQDTDSTNYRADYVTRFDYDGNEIATDNWEHLTRFPLAAYVYYSVVETCTHWFIAYGFFHPRDWDDSNFKEEHENDMEGLLTIVRKDGTPVGKLEGMITVYHLDLLSYTPPDSPLRNGHENINGTLTLQQYNGAWRPLTVQEAKGHGLKAFPYTSDFHGNPNEDGIIYYPSHVNAGVPTSGNDRHVDYMLIDFFAPGGLWPRQLDDAPLSRDQAATFAKWGSIKGDDGGGCGSGITVTCATDSASPPWGWDDHDDGPSYRGEMGLDPAHLVAHYFSGLGNFSTKYLRNRYASDLKARGYRHGNVPRGWSIESFDRYTHKTVVEDDRTGRINLDELFSRLTMTCP